jgi:hypothetical protein
LYQTNLPGRDEIKQKISSARKARSVHANMFMASAQGGATSKAIRIDKGHKTLSAAPTDTEWFCRFMTGLRSRIGERHRQDAAISIELMLELQKRLEAKWQEAVIKNDIGLMRDTAEDVAFFLFTYCGSLRGYETPKVILQDLRRQIIPPEAAFEATKKGHKLLPHVSLLLEGRFKARLQEIQR